MCEVSTTAVIAQVYKRSACREMVAVLILANLLATGSDIIVGTDP